MDIKNKFYIYLSCSKMRVEHLSVYLVFPINVILCGVLTPEKQAKFTNWSSNEYIFQININVLVPAIAILIQIS